MKMARTNVEWVGHGARVGAGGVERARLRGETQVSKARPGPPTQSLEVGACFSCRAKRSGETRPLAIPQN